MSRASAWSQDSWLVLEQFVDLRHEIGRQFRGGGALGDLLGVLRDQFAGQLVFEMVAGVLMDYLATGDHFRNAIKFKLALDKIDQLTARHCIKLPPVIASPRRRLGFSPYRDGAAARFD